MNRFLEFFLYIFLVDYHLFLFHFRNVKGNVLKEFFQHGVQSSGSDVFRLLVHQERHCGYLVDSVLGELHLNAFCFQQRLVLLKKCVFRLGEYFDKVLLGKIVKGDSYRKASLQLRYKVCRLGGVEGSCTDKQNVICLYWTVLCIDYASLYDRQYVCLLYTSDAADEG